MNNDTNKLTKTDRILILIRELVNTKDNILDEYRVKEILGSPSRAQWYKIIKELTTENEERPPLLIAVNENQYLLNSCFRENIS
ncbi:MAG: hypothetical protein OHK0056_25100 [Bacteriovoracaceae bacterium]